MNIKEFKLNYSKIKARGFIEITRKGDGKFGNTFEDLLGLTAVSYTHLRAHET